MTAAAPRRVLVVVAHPDDETIGAGGTIARWADAGAEVVVHVVTRCAVDRYDLDAVAATTRRRAEARAAAGVLGVKHSLFSEYPEIRLAQRTLPDELVDLIRRNVNVYGPDVVLTHWWGELNVDHRAVSEAVQVAVRPFTQPTLRAVLAFQVDPYLPPGAPAFRTTRWVALRPQDIRRKMEALAQYRSETREWPHPRSAANVHDIMLMTGAQAGLEAAEAFEVVWEVER